MKNADSTNIAEFVSPDKGGAKRQVQRAYLLRCWQEQAAPGEEPRWRFSLEEVLHERWRKGFDSPEALIAFLRAELSGSAGEPFD
jgi:hypothetical protein